MIAREVPGTGPLIPRRLRGPLFGLAAACAVLIVALGVRYHDDRTFGRLDRWVVDELPWAIPVRSPALSSFGALTGMAEAVVVATVLAMAFCVLRRWRLAALALAGPALTVLMTVAGKHLVQREFYDDPDSLAYPSGHTAGVTAVALVVALAAIQRVGTRVVVAGLVAMLAVMAVAASVGLVMVLLNGHYATDVIAGYGTAVTATVSTAAVLDRVRLPVWRLQWVGPG
ncbi:phosphatase PAP2 family protein [Geodermatophilus sp. SYSU D00758]